VAPEPSTFASALDDALRAAFGESVDAVSIQTLGDGVGLLATLTRVELRDGMRVVVKAPTSDPGNRAIAHRFGYYAREAGTYHSLLPRPGIRAPECFAVVNGVDGPVIVLEDLGDLRAGDQVAGASVADAFAAADLLGALHAAFWNDPVLAACSWLPGPTDEVVRGYRTLFELTWDTFRDRVRGLVPDPHLAAAERAIGWFDSVCDAFAHAPRTLVHGDFRLDNLLVDSVDSVDGADQVTAVLDWEMATLGDPLTDVALLHAYLTMPSMVDSRAVSDASLAPGFLSPDEVLARYGEASGRDLSDLAFHLGLAYFKLAVILEGIHFRYTQGQTVGAGFEAIGDAVAPLVAQGLRSIKED
jgi:aminoglycoside phosphotransferase (APT) family kinase protein